MYLELTPTEYHVKYGQFDYWITKANTGESNWFILCVRTGVLHEFQKLVFPDYPHGFASTQQAVNHLKTYLQKNKQ